MLEKDKIIRVRIEESDKELIKNYCKKYGLTVSNFIRFAALQKVREDLEKEEKQ